MTLDLLPHFIVIKPVVFTLYFIPILPYSVFDKCPRLVLKCSLQDSYSIGIELPRELDNNADPWTPIMVFESEGKVDNTLLFMLL